MTYNFKKARIAGALTLAFMAAVGNELTGYNLFDQEDGGNIICSIDPSCRKLTDNEIMFAKTIFGDSLDYKKIKIFNRYLFGRKPEGASGRMWNGNIYAITTDARSQDYALDERLGNRRLFLHEMTHVWQYKSDPAFMVKGLSALIKADFNYSSLYPYEIKPHRTFKDYNFEQQADIADDYYGLTENLKKADESGTSGQNEICRDIISYERILRPVLPIGPTPPQCLQIKATP